MIARLADLLGIEIPVPGSDLEAAFFLIDGLLHVSCLAVSIGDCGHRQVGQKLVYGRNIFRCLVFQLIGGMVFVTEQFGAFRSQLCGPKNDLARIKRSVLTITGERGLHDALAQGTVLQRAKQRLASRIL